MKKELILILTSLLCCTCGSQKKVNTLPDEFLRIQNRFEHEIMDEQNLFVFKFQDIDSIFCEKDSKLRKIKVMTKNKSPIVILFSQKGKDFNVFSNHNRERVIVYKNSDKMVINSQFINSDMFGHCVLIDSILFKKGEFNLVYYFLDIVENGTKNKLILKNYFNNKQEQKDFSNLKFNYINFLKDKNKFSWKKKE